MPLRLLVALILVFICRPSQARFSVGLVTSYFSYVEPSFMREYGFLQGVALGYEQLSESETYLFETEADYQLGHLTYDGAVVSSGISTPSVQRAADSILNLRGTVGYVNQLESGWTLAPYAGIGYRLLKDKIEGVSSYLRTVSYLYAPIGARLDLPISEFFSIVTTADIDVILYGMVVSQLSDVNPSFPDLQMTNSGVGYSASISLKYGFENFTGYLTPYYQKWDIQRSTQSMGFVEPANQTDLVGLNVGADF